MTVTFDRTEADLIHFNHYHWRHSPAMQRQYRRQFLIGPIIGLAVAFMLRDRGLVFVVFTVVGTTGLYAFFLWWFTRRNIRNVVRNMLSEAKRQGHVGRRQITIRPDGIVERTDSSESRQSWSSVERVAEDEHFIFIYVQALAAHVIPKTAFSSAAEAQAFLAEARSYLPTA